MLHSLISALSADCYEVIHLKQNHAWINPFNWALAVFIKSNHNIFWIPTVTKSLCLIYYITNYAAKDNLITQQILIKAVLVQEALEKAQNTTDLTSDQIAVQSQA